MYTNPYINVYNPQPSIDRINSQIAELERMKQQLQQQPTITPPTNLTQNFQLASTNKETIKYATSMEEVQRDMVMGDTPYFAKDMSVVWIKDTKGEIKTYELIEIIPKDEKDMQIDFLMNQIAELKGMVKNESSIRNVDEQYNETSTSEDDGTNGTTIKETKSSGLSRISKSKTK